MKNLKNKDKYSIEEVFLSRISKIVDKLVGEREIFKNLDKNELIDFLSSLKEKWSHEQRMSVTDDELTDRIEKIMLIEATVEAFNEISPEKNGVFRSGDKTERAIQMSYTLDTSTVIAIIKNEEKIRRGNFLIEKKFP